MTGRVFSKLLFAFVVLLVLGTTLLDFSIRRIVDSALRGQIETSLSAEAALLGAQLNAGERPQMEQLIRSAARAAHADVAVFGDGGGLLSSYPEGQPPALGEAARGLLPGSPSAIRVVHDKTLYVSVRSGELTVRMGYPLAEIRAQLRLLRLNVLLASLGSLLLATLLAIVFAQRVARRLRRIVNFAERIAAGDLTARVEEGDLDEISTVAHALDTTASQLEQAFGSLESSRRELTTLLDSMQEGVIAVTATRQVSWSNAVVSRLAHGAVLEGRSLVHAIRDPEVLTCVEAALHLRRVSTGRALSVAPGRTFEVNAAPMPGGGAVVVLHDVTEVERAETTRRDFVANVSHELRTPLTSITGYVEAVLDGAESLSGQEREFLAIVLRNAARMNRLTEDLLALARVESADYKLALQPARASDLVEDAVETLAPLVIDAGLVLEPAEATEEWVLADPDALQQVFGNLIENATKYGRTGKRVRVGAVRQGEHVEFYVRDFGPGIASEHQPRIFERFYRVDKARSRDSGGTGLGLSIARHIVQAHRGQIRIESELGYGATFVFSLPITVHEGGASGAARDRSGAALPVKSPVVL